LKYEKIKKALEELLKKYEGNKNKEEDLDSKMQIIKEILDKQKEDKIQETIAKIKDLPEYKEVEEMEGGIKNEVVVSYDLYNSKEVREQKRKEKEELNNVANQIKDFMNKNGIEPTVEQQKVFNNIENINIEEKAEKSEAFNQNMPKKKKKNKCLIM